MPNPKKGKAPQNPASVDLFVDSEATTRPNSVENEDLGDSVTDVLAKIVPVLSKFENISQTLSSDLQPTLPYVIPKIHFLHNHLFSIKVKRDSPEDRPLNELVQVEILKRY